MRPVLLALVAATMTLAACGGDDSAREDDADARGVDRPAAIKTYLPRPHAAALARRGDDEGERAAVPRPRRAERLRHQEAAGRPPAGGRQAPRRRQEDLRRRQPRLRGDGGRGGRRALARRLRRDHRRGRRRLGSRERGPVLDQDRGRQDLQAAGQPVLPRSRARSTARSRSGRPRPTSTATARSSSARRCPTRASTSPR